MEEKISPPWRLHQLLFSPFLQERFSFLYFNKIRLSSSSSSTLRISDLNHGLSWSLFYHRFWWSSSPPWFCHCARFSLVHRSFVAGQTLAHRSYWQSSLFPSSMMDVFFHGSSSVFVPAPFFDHSLLLASGSLEGLWWWITSSGSGDFSGGGASLHPTWLSLSHYCCSWSSISHPLFGSGHQWLLVELVWWSMVVCVCSHIRLVWRSELLVVAVWFGFVADFVLSAGVCSVPLATVLLHRSNVWWFVLWSIIFSSDFAPAPYPVNSPPCCSSPFWMVLDKVDTKMSGGALHLGRVCLSRGAGGSFVFCLVAIFWLVCLVQVGFADEVVLWFRVVCRLLFLGLWLSFFVVFPFNYDCFVALGHSCNFFSIWFIQSITL